MVLESEEAHQKTRARGWEILKYGQMQKDVVQLGNQNSSVYWRDLSNLDSSKQGNQNQLSPRVPLTC